MRASRRSPSAGIRLIGVADRYCDADVGGTERLEVTDRTVRGHRQAACEHMCRYGRPNSSPLVVTFDRDCPLQMSVSMACLT
jgi:hypothetical protein